MSKTAIIEIRLQDFDGVPDHIYSPVVKAVEDYHLGSYQLKELGGYDVSVRVEEHDADEEA